MHATEVADTSNIYNSDSIRQFDNTDQSRIDIVRSYVHFVVYEIYCSMLVAKKGRLKSNENTLFNLASENAPMNDKTTTGSVKNLAIEKDRLET